MPKTLTFTPKQISIMRVNIPSDNLDDLRIALTEKLNAAPSDFFKNTGIIADLKQITTTDTEWLKNLKSVFKEVNLYLIGISQHHFSLEQLADLSLIDVPKQRQRTASAKPTHNFDTTSVKVTPSVTDNAVAHAPTAQSSIASKLIRGNVRSGQRIYAQDTDLIIVGTVSAGAEIIADGNIHVLGILRGRAFAGASGNENTHIYCNELAAELVSIAGNYQNMEQLYPYKGGKNCLITLNKDETMLIVSL